MFFSAELSIRVGDVSDFSVCFAQVGGLLLEEYDGHRVLLARILSRDIFEGIC